MSELLELSEPSPSGVRTLTLKRGDKSNALSKEMVERLHAVLDEVGRETRLLALRSDSKNFCAGFDMSGVEESSDAELVLRFIRINELLARIRRLPYISVAWISGAVYGAGADIACACTFRVAFGPVKFRFPGFQFGVALGTRRLAQLVGGDRARRILLTNEIVSTDEAISCGLVNASLEDQSLHGYLENLSDSTMKLDNTAMGTLLELTDPQDADMELAALVRSVSRPGLASRISAYRAV